MKNEDEQRKLDIRIREMINSDPAIQSQAAEILRDLSLAYGKGSPLFNLLSRLDIVENTIQYSKQICDALLDTLQVDFSLYEGSNNRRTAIVKCLAIQMASAPKDAFYMMFDVRDNYAIISFVTHILAYHFHTPCKYPLRQFQQNAIITMISNLLLEGTDDQIKLMEGTISGWEDMLLDFIANTQREKSVLGEYLSFRQEETGPENLAPVSVHLTWQRKGFRPVPNLDNL